MNIENMQTVQITNALHEVGIPANILGYDYLKQAIGLVLSDKTYLRAVTKRLYPTIAEKNGTTSPRAERAMRHAIETGWSRGDVNTLNSYFGYTIHSVRGKPTNSEFIAMMAEAIELKNLKEAEE
jgi:two-component system response regulator (stage 0 sporulation protein A)